MIRDLSIKNFRGFKHFEMRGLGRVNLLVGTNNSGKTSVLEAIQLLSARGDPSAIWSISGRRGERLWDDSDRRTRNEADVCHLFHGHVIEAGTEFCLEQSDGDSTERMVGRIAQEQTDEDSQPQLLDLDELSGGSLALYLSATGRVEEYLKLSPRGGLSWDTIRHRPSRGNGATPSTRFITTASMSVDEVVSLFEDVVLTPDEDVLIEALKTIDPTIERIASVGAEQRRFDPHRVGGGGIVVKCDGVAQRVPIGSMGDGMWRMLGLALSLVRAESGILLVDEIDTGLHFSVMSKMWKLVNTTAERLGVQVFATTHSRDCYQSLAAISRVNVSDESVVTIQRIERDQHQSVAFTEQEIVIAADRGIEVR